MMSGAGQQSQNPLGPRGGGVFNLGPDKNVLANARGKINNSKSQNTLSAANIGNLF
jgi:hypothetical protein